MPLLFFIKAFYFLGTKDLVILQSITKVFTAAIRYVAVDPIGDNIKAFKQNISDMPGLGHVEFQFHSKTFEEYMEQRKNKESFHLITNIHVMYYADTEIWMRYFNEILKENSRVLIFLAVPGEL